MHPLARSTLAVFLLAQLLFPGFLLQTALSAPVSPVTVSFQEGVSPAQSYAGARDATLSQYKPTTNYGSASTLYVDGDDPQRSCKDLSAVLLWDISNIPAGSTVTSASITIRVTDPASTGYKLFELKRDWAENRVNWIYYSSGKKWQTAGAKGALDRGTAVLGTAAPGATGNYTFQLTGAGISRLQAWVNNPASNSGLILADATNKDRLAFYSSQAQSRSYRPMLTVTYIPPLSNQPPVAYNQNANTQEDNPVDILLQASDPDGDPLTYSIEEQPAHGSLSLNGSTAIYTPQPDFSGSDRFTFKASDALLFSNIATVNISVSPVNDPPVARFSAIPDAGVPPLKVNLDASASTDVDGSVVSYAWNFGDNRTGNGRITNPVYAIPGSYTISLTVTDDQGATHATFLPIAVSEKPSPETPRNVILFIGDGMGAEHIKAAGMVAHGQAGTLSFESFPSHASMTTHSANSPVTDSAASATAMATGFKVNNEVISMAIPGDGRELTTLLEEFRDAGKTTGLVTTSSVNDASPAAFAAHEPDRANDGQIAADYFNQTRPNILFGAAGTGITPEAAEAAGYTVVQDRASMQALDTETQTYLSGQFGQGMLPYEYDGLGDLPHLSEMVSTALAVLDNDPDGFFLLVENEGVDEASHAHDILRTTTEIVELSNAVQAAIDFSTSHPDTLILVTADHETGGLQVIQNNGQGNFPTVSWSTEGHTATLVNVYAAGVNAGLVSGTLDNTDIPAVVKGAWQNQAPSVSAGPDQSLSLPATANLDGAVSDDGLPNPPGATTVAWSKVSGPGSVSFTDPGAADTVASFSQPGTYTLRLAADDGEFIAADDVVVQIYPENTQQMSLSFQDGVFPNAAYSGTRDAFINQDFPDANYAIEQELVVDGDDPGISSRDISTFIKWDITSIPPGSQVTGASLTIEVTNATTQVYNLYAVKRNWLEDQVSWNVFATGSPWEVGGARGAADRGDLSLGTLSPNLTGSYTVQLNSDALTLIQSWIDDPAANFGFILVDRYNSDGMDFYSREFGVAQMRPRLTITYR